jgi:NADH-quinone oxidoreductase subunit K
MITLQHYLILALMLFAIGMAGVLTRKNTILVFISLEIMLNAVNLMFLAGAYYLKDGAGQVMVVFSMTVAATLTHE